MKKGPTFRYGLIQAGYWMDYLVIASFAAVFLGGRGFTTGQIGTLMAVSALLSCVLQQVSGTIADKYERIPLKYLVSLFIGVCVLSFAAMMILPHGIMVTAVFYITAYSLQAALAPLISSLCLQFSNNNYDINFGLARSMGSFGYSLAAFLMGYITDAFGPEIILPIYIGIYAVVLVLLFLFPVPQKDADAKIVAGNELLEDEQPSSMRQFFHKYHRFTVFMVGIIFVWFGNSLLSTYMIYFIQDLGGTSADMGLALSIMALSEIPAVMFGSNIMKRIGAGNMLRISAVGGIVKSFLFWIAMNVTFFTWLNVTHFFLSGFYQVSAVYYGYAIVGEKDIVKGQAIMGIAATGVCAMAANYLSGLMIEIMPLKSILFLCVVTSVIGAVIFFIATDPKRFKNEVVRKI